MSTCKIIIHVQENYVLIDDIKTTSLSYLLRTSDIRHLFFSLYMFTIKTMLREMVKITQLPFHKPILLVLKIFLKSEL